MELPVDGSTKEKRKHATVGYGKQTPTSTGSFTQAVLSGVSPLEIMGKKASLKINMGYYLDDDEEDYWDDDNDQLKPRSPLHREPSSKPVKAGTTVHRTKPRRLDP